MAKRIVKRKKIRFIPFLLFLLVFTGIGFLFYAYLMIPIQNIIIQGNSIISDDEVIRLAGIKNYPSFYLSDTSKMKKNILTSSVVKKVNIRRSFFHVLTINIQENKILFYDVSKNVSVLENETTIPNQYLSFRVPRLMNHVPEKKYRSFISGMSKINEAVWSKISDIEYVPNEVDKDRFLLYMDDGNSVYITLTKFKMINYYNKVLTQLEGRKGILYLDNGNHFQIMQ